jgi:hypothetical protein
MWVAGSKFHLNKNKKQIRGERRVQVLSEQEYKTNKRREKSAEQEYCES